MKKLKERMMNFKRISVFVLTFIAIVSAKEMVPAVPSQALDGCYQISTAEELYGFAQIVNGDDVVPANGSVCGELQKDIVVNKDVLNDWGWLNDENEDDFVVWEPMASFSGTFNGNGHIISGLYSNNSSGLFQELLSSENNTVVIKDLGIVDSYFSSKTNLGVLADYVSGKGETQVTNFYSRSTIVSTSYSKSSLPYIGGIVGHVDEISSLTLTNCYSAGRLADGNYKYYQNLLGYADNEYGRVKVSNCYSLKQESGDYLNYGTLVDSASFRNGAVAFALSEETSGSIWGQDVKTDKFPNFSGELKNSTAQRYSVTFHSFSGDTAKYFDTYIAGFNVPLPDVVVPKNMYFGGWYKDAEYSDHFEVAIPDTATGNLEYWAKVNEVYKITYHADGVKLAINDLLCVSSSNEMPVYKDDDPTQCYLSGVGQKLYSGIKRDSSIFMGWYDNEELTGNPIDSITPDESGDKDFYAKWFDLKRPAIDPADGCYEISDVAELYGFAALVNGEFSEKAEAGKNLCGKLTKDIVVNQNVLNEDGTLNSAKAQDFLYWIPIEFEGGIFDGQGHKISGLYMDRNGMISFNGMFICKEGDYAYTAVSIRNLKIEDTFISSGYIAGGIVSYAERWVNLEIDNVHFSGTVEGENDGIGGLVGEVVGVTVIKNSSHHGKVYNRGSGPTGGLIGLGKGGYLVLLQNYNEGSVEMNYVMNTWVTEGVGGLIGEYAGHAFIANNYNLADIVCANKYCRSSGLIGRYYYFDGRDEELKPLQSFVLNNYNKGIVSEVVTPSELKLEEVVFENNYYLTGTEPSDDVGISVDASAFVDGTVAKALHDYVQKDSAGKKVAGGVTGINWIQGDEYPVFEKDEARDIIVLRVGEAVTLSTSVVLHTYGESLALPTASAEGYSFLGWDVDYISEIPATESGLKILFGKFEKLPSSSSVASSSSEMSSSSEATSSSSIKEDKSSSSSAKSGKSSSSSAKSGKSSSSSKGGKESVFVHAQLPHFSVTTMGRDIQVAHARVGSTYALFDMQGRVLTAGRVNSENFNITVPRAGTYLVRVGREARKEVLK